MSLNYDFEGAPNGKKMMSADEWPITEAIIFATMAIGLHEITEKNVDDFWCRINAQEMAFGALCYEGGADGPVPRYTSLEDIRLRIGLKTNASPKTKHQFMKGLGEHLLRDAQRRLVNKKREEKEAEAVAG